MQSVLLVSNSQETMNKAGLIIFHPERNNLIPKFCPLKNYFWTSIRHLSDFGLIYVPPKTKRKLRVEPGYIYIIGGYDNVKKKYARSVLRYDLLKGNWFHCSKMKTRRACFTPFLHDGKIFCAGGYISKSVITDLVESYEPMINMILMESPLPLPCCDYGCVFIRKKAFIIGGNIQTANGDIKASSHFWSLENVENEFNYSNKILKFIEVSQAKLPLENGIIGHKVAICEKNNCIYVVGGTNNDSETDKAAGLYYAYIDSLLLSKHKEGPEEIVWFKRNIPEMQASYHGISLIKNKIFVIGGFITNSCDAREIEMESLNENHDPGDSEVSKNLESSNNDHNNDNSSHDKNKTNEKPMDCRIVNDTVGYFDWRRKIFNNSFKLRNRNDINLEKIHCAVVDMNEKYEEFNKDRYDWLLQWALW